MGPCCIIVAIIFAQITATLRRWGVFWGVVPPDAFDSTDTVMARARRWVALPGVRVAATAVLAMEIVSFGWWVSAYHGQHLYHLADQAVAGLHGETVIYAPVCDGSGQSHVKRLSFARDRLALRD